MLFNSFEFLIFFPIVVLIYYCIPQKIRYIWLLVSSYFFYMCWNKTYAILLAVSTVVSYISGLLIKKVQCRISDQEIDTKINRLLIFEKLVVAVSVLLNLGILFFYKYTGFLIDSIFPVVKALYPQGNFEMPMFDILLPIGISFYTFKSISYTIDVYRSKTEVEKNPLSYALYVAFFPQLAAGPIERSNQMLTQIHEKHSFSQKHIRDGALLMLWGYFQKMIIADRAAILVDQVFSHYQHYNGIQIIVAIFLFAIQIYCDFGGYSNLAIGAASILGYKTRKNFDTPYFSDSVAEFWRRWHISLTSWFRDYIYIPLGGNRKGTKKKYRNILIVFMASGLWHGADWHFVLWGGLNGLYQVIAQILHPIREKAVKVFRIRTDTFSHKLLRVIGTFIRVDIAWVFFRADSILDGFLMLGRIFTDFNIGALFNGSLYEMSLSQTEFNILILAMLLQLFVSILEYKKFPIRSFLEKQGLWFQFTVYLVLIFTVLVFGIYGPAFDASQFLYFKF